MLNEGTTRAGTGELCRVSPASLYLTLAATRRGEGSQHVNMVKSEVILTLQQKTAEVESLQLQVCTATTRALLGATARRKHIPTTVSLRSSTPLSPNAVCAIAVPTPSFAGLAGQNVEPSSVLVSTPSEPVQSSAKGEGRMCSRSWRGRYVDREIAN